MGHTQDFFFAEITKADHQLSESFYFIKISCFDLVMNLFLSWVMFSVKKKKSFPAKTEVENPHLGYTYLNKDLIA